MSYIVTVDWKIEPDRSEDFAKYAKKQAENSINLETDCLFFDLSRSEEERNRFFMYEIYTSREAFDIHLASDHFKDFSMKIDGMVIARDLRTHRKI